MLDLRFPRTFGPAMGGRLLPEQEEYFWSPAKITGFIGAIGTGKSRMGMSRAHFHTIAPRVAFEDETLRNIEVLMLCDYNESLMDKVYPIWREEIPDEFFIDFHQTDKVAWVRTWDDFIATVRFRPVNENPDRLKGHPPHYVHIEEASQVVAAAWHLTMSRAMRAYPKARISLSTTPKGMNWVYNEVWKPFQAGDPDVKCWQLKYADCTKTKDRPYGWLSQEMLEMAKKKLPERLFRQQYEASFENFTGQVYEEFLRAVHVIPHFEPPVHWERWMGVDFGYTAPFACVWIARDPESGCLYAYREHYQAAMRLCEHAEIIKGMQAGEQIEFGVGDSEDPQQILELAGLGVPLVPAKKGPDSIDSGVQRVAMKLRCLRGRPWPKWAGPQRADGAPMLFVSDHCPKMIEEFETWAYEEIDASRQDTRTRYEGACHAVDALRYVISMLEEMRVLSEAPDLDSEGVIWTPQKAARERAMAAVGEVGDGWYAQEMYGAAYYN